MAALLTSKEVRALEKGDEIHDGPLFGCLTDEPICLSLTKIEGEEREFLATYYGIVLGTVTLQKNNKWRVSW